MWWSGFQDEIEVATAYQVAALIALPFALVIAGLIAGYVIWG